MSLQWGWYILPLVISLICFGNAIYFHISMRSLKNGASGPALDMMNYLSGVQAEYIAGRYAVAVFISGLAWGAYFLFN